MTREEIIQLALDIGLRAARSYKYRGSLESMTEPERKELEHLLEFANKITQRDEALLRQALEALEVYAEYDPEGGGVADNAIAALRERLASGHECADTIRALLAERDALRDALSEALTRIAAIGYPASPDGEYSEDGEWTFSDAVPRAVDAEEVKAAFLVIRAALRERLAHYQHADNEGSEPSRRQCAL